MVLVFVADNIFVHNQVFHLCINMQYFQVITKDGYILSIQRIPEGRSEAKSNVTKKKEPVIVQHGVAVVS